MALAQIFRQAFSRRGIAVGPDDAIALEFDCILRESRDLSSQPSEFPLEDAAIITDHLRRLPERLTLDVLISANPVSLLRSAAGTLNGLVSNLVAQRAASLGGSGVGAIAGTGAALGFGEVQGLVLSTNDRVKKAWDQLYQMWKTSTLLVIVTGFDVYRSMGITNLSTIRVADNGSDLAFTITLQKITLVAVGQISQVANVDRSIAPGASQTVQLGNQPVSPADAPLADQASGLMSKITSILD